MLSSRNVLNRFDYVNPKELAQVARASTDKLFESPLAQLYPWGRPQDPGQPINCPVWVGRDELMGLTSCRCGCGYLPK